MPIYLSGLSNIAYTATQFALLSSVAVIGRTFMAGPAGYAAEKLGWTGFWGLTVLAAIPGMILLWMMWRKGYVVQSIRQSGAVELDEGKLRKPVGAARVVGFALIVAGVVGVLLAQPARAGVAYHVRVARRRRRRGAAGVEGPAPKVA